MQMSNSVVSCHEEERPGRQPVGGSVVMAGPGKAVPGGPPRGIMMVVMVGVVPDRGPPRSTQSSGPVSLTLAKALGTH